MNANAWSEERESTLKVYNALSWLVIVLGLAAVVSGLIVPSKTLWISGIVVVIAAAVWGSIVKTELQFMTPNRPYHGSEGLTLWHWHHFNTIGFKCVCGLDQTFEGKQFFARTTDPGGGRYSFVCGCGRGHYKFRVDKW